MNEHRTDAHAPRQADCGVVVVAAGSGTRMGGGLPKQFRPLLGLPLLYWSVRFFNARKSVREVVVVVPPDCEGQVKADCLQSGFHKVAAVVAGGARRQDSTQAGLDALSPECTIVAVHDAARPFPPLGLSTAIAHVREQGAAIFAAPVSDTIKRADPKGRILATIDRASLWAAQTPQIFRRGILVESLRKCAEQGLDITDEASAVEMAGYPVDILPAPRTNLKITSPEDWPLAETLGRSRQESTD